MRDLDGKVAPRTVNAHRQVLASVFADAVARGWRDVRFKQPVLHV